jgi:hypothetical protein
VAVVFIGLALCPLPFLKSLSFSVGGCSSPRTGCSVTLLSMGLITDKISLMYAEFAAFVGLIYVTLPYCFSFCSIFDIDKRMIETAPTLAHHLTTFRGATADMDWRTVAFSQSFI